MPSNVIVPKLILFAGILFFIAAGLLVRHRRTVDSHQSEDRKRMFAFEKVREGVRLAGLSYFVLLLLVAVLLVGHMATTGPASVDAANLKATGWVTLILSTLFWPPLFAAGWGWKLGRSVGVAIENGYWVKFLCFVGCLSGVVSAADVVYLENWNLTSTLEEVVTGYLAICGMLALSLGLAGYSRGLVPKK
jgi:hypothetical protein